MIIMLTRSFVSSRPLLWKILTCGGVCRELIFNPFCPQINSLSQYRQSYDYWIRPPLSSLWIAQKLNLFPNLHSLQLIFRFLPTRKGHVNFFSEFRYPNIRTLVLSRLRPYRDILHACPNVRHVSAYNDKEFHIREILDKECASGIEKLGQVLGLKPNLNGTSAHFLLSVFSERIFNTLRRYGQTPPLSLWSLLEPT